MSNIPVAMPFIKSILNTVCDLVTVLIDPKQKPQAAARTLMETGNSHDTEKKEDYLNTENK